MSKYNEEGFDEENFLKYMKETPDSEFYEENIHEKLTQVLSNIVDFSHKHHHIAKDDFAYTVSDMTGIDFEDVIRFCEDAILTKTAQEVRDGQIKEDIPEEEFYKGFAKEPFMKFAEYSYEANLDDVLHNLLDTLYRYENVSRDQLAENVSDFTGVPFEKVVQFCSDDILTRDSIEIKHPNQKQENQKQEMELC